jgi:hypothetical protein
MARRLFVLSAGVLLFITVTGHSPYKGKTHNDMLRAIMRARLPTTAPGWATLSTELQDLISVMLQVSEPGCTREREQEEENNASHLFLTQISFI